jgi:hypothetical protein
MGRRLIAMAIFIALAPPAMAEPGLANHVFFLAGTDFAQASMSA